VENLLVKTTRFDTIDVSVEDILQFSHGLPGFPEEKEFAFLSNQSDGPFAFLQSITEQNLTFMIVEPFTFFNDYSFEIDPVISEELGISESNPPQIFTIVRVPEKVEEMTVNLSAPIVINWRDQKAMQIVLEKTSYTVRHRLFPEGLPGEIVQGGK
jgi:flagellar assembly factor FliW